MRRLALAALILGLAPTARAHPLAPSLLELRERGDGRVDVGWKTPLVRPRGAPLVPVLPAGCRRVEPDVVTREDGGIWTRWVVACEGLVGARVGIDGSAAAGIGAVVRVTVADGRVLEGVVTPSRPLFTVPPRPRPLDVARDYARLGVGHILAGPDHLLFVFGLLLLAGTARRVVATVSAFTVGHSVTLTLAALGVVRFPSAVIEVLIAASVLALAVELARRPGGPTLMRRRPWLMAATFGLLHGLGFASALREAGLPAGEIPLALAAFNVGIEAGQLGFVLAVSVVGALGRRLPGRMPGWAARVPVYVMGSLAASWWLERMGMWLW